MNGVLVIDKPQGPTSFDVVKKVRALLRVPKVGHTGTLDPMATGVLPLCIGDATRIAGFIIEGDKAYDATLKLGVTTDTLDAEGQIVARREVPELTGDSIEAAFARLRGTYDQVPPMYSAVKVGGKRLYELARAGQEVERAARRVTVHELVLRDYSRDTLTFSVRASKGFFVRVLAEQIGEALGCGAHLISLRRTKSGPFTLQQALGLERVEALVRTAPAELAAQLVSPEEALSELPSVQVSEQEAARVANGVPLEVKAEAGRVRVMGPSGQLLAVAEVTPARRLRYLRVLAARAN